MPWEWLSGWIDQLQYGTVPAWFGGLSLLFAFFLFYRDRRKEDREQIDKVAVWITTAYDRQFLGMDGKIDRIEEARHTVFTKNANEVPIEIHQV